jgi:hypothetical protein
MCNAPKVGDVEERTGYGGGSYFVFVSDPVRGLLLISTIHDMIGIHIKLPRMMTSLK